MRPDIVAADGVDAIEVIGLESSRCARAGELEGVFDRGAGLWHLILELFFALHKHAVEQPCSRPLSRSAPFETHRQVQQAGQRRLRHSGPRARQGPADGGRGPSSIIKLNIGNLAAFGLEPPDEIVQDMIRNLAGGAGYTDSKGLFAPRKAVVHYTQEKRIAGRHR